MTKTIIPADTEEYALVIWGDAEEVHPAEYQRIVAWVVDDTLQPVFLDWNVEASEYCLVLLSNHGQSWTERRLGQTFANTESAIEFAKNHFQNAPVYRVQTPRA